MYKFDKKGIYFYGSNREFGLFLRNFLFIDIPLKKLIEIRLKRLQAK